MLNGLRQELHDKTYRPQPVSDDSEAGRGRATRGDADHPGPVVQTAAKLILEPIFEADLR